MYTKNEKKQMRPKQQKRIICHRKEPIRVDIVGKLTTGRALVINHVIIRLGHNRLSCLHNTVNSVHQKNCP